jgi:hypothetical protein
MAQLTGVLALLLSDTPVLPLNVTRYTTALTQAMNNLNPANPADLGIKLFILSFNGKKYKTLFLDVLRNAISDFGQGAEDFVARSKLMDVQK